MNSRNRSSGGWKVILLLFAVLAIGIGVLVTVFRIRSVKISAVGESRHSTQEIEEDLMYDFLTRNTLYLAWKYRSATEEPRAPYLEQVKAKILTPSCVQLIVQEKELIGVTVYNGRYVYFDENGIVLEITDTLYPDIPVITGVSMTEPELYLKLPVTSPALRTAMLKIARLLRDSPMQPDEISFDENMNITATFGTVTVLLGQNDYLEEKVANLDTIYQKISNQEGTLNMTAFTGKNETITFVKAEDEAARKQAQGSSGGEEGDEEGSSEKENEEKSAKGPSSTEQFMVFDAGGILHYDARVVDGVIVDSSGMAISGCYLDSDGNAVDAYGNIQELYLTMPSSDDDSSGSSASDETKEDEDSGKVVGETTGLSAFAVFDANGVIREDAHVVNGKVVDASGYEIAGCYVNENGNVVDGFWNEINPYTGQPVNLG